MRLLKFFSLCSIFTALCSVSIFAQSVQEIDDFNRKIPGTKNSNYLRLITQIFPDARISEEYRGNAVASSSVPMRHLFRNEKKRTYAGKLLIRQVSFLTAVNENKNGEDEKPLWLFIGLSEREKETCGNCDERILAVFDLGATKLIDAANVKTEDATLFWDEQPKIRIAPRSEAVVIYNSFQIESGESAYSLVTATENGFNVVLKQFTLRRIARCGKQLDEWLRLRRLERKTKGAFDLEITVTSETGDDYDTTPEKTPKPDWRGRFRYVFAWQPKTRNYKAIVNPDRRRKQAVDRYFRPPRCD